MIGKTRIMGVFSLVLILFVSLLVGSHTFNNSVPESSIETIGDTGNIERFQSERRGTVISNTTWTAMDSPVNITDNLTVAAGQMLNITSGVTVIFQGNYSIKVEGRLNCTGNISSPVTISGNDTLHNCSGSYIELEAGGTLEIDRSNIENITGFVWRGSGTLANSTFINCSLPVAFHDVSTAPYVLLNTSFRNSSITDISLDNSNVSVLDCVNYTSATLSRHFNDTPSHLREWVSFSVRTLEDTGEALEDCHLKVENSSHTVYSTSHFLGSDPVTGPGGESQKIKMLSNLSSAGSWKNETANISVYMQTNEGEWNESGGSYSLDSLIPGTMLNIVANEDIFPPDPPKNLKVEQVNNSIVNISWTAGNSPDISGHLVYYNDSGNWVQIANISAPVNYTQYTPVEVGNNSSFRAQSYDDEFLASQLGPERWITVTDVEAPQIISTEPGGSGVPVNTIIKIIFSEPMDQVSVQNSFRLSPSPDLSMYFTDNNRTFNVRPFLPLNPFTTYTVNISTDANDASGNNVSENYSFNFTTAPDTTSPRVLSVRATHVNAHEEKVFLISNFEISFSESVNETSFIRGFSRFPFLEGKIISSDQRKVFLFDPSNDLDYGTTYQITLHSNITDLAGNRLSSDYHVNFTTVSEPLVVIPEVLDFGPVGNKISIHTEIHINFSEAMNKSRIIGALSITPDVFFEYNHSMDNKNFSFIPVVPLKGSTFYNVTLSQNAKSLAGFSILHALNFNFTTHETERPKVVSTLPEANKRDVSVGSNIIFWFDEAVFATDTIPVSFFPQVNFSWMINQSENSLVINVTGILAYGQEYRIGVSGLADIFGNVMNYEWLLFETEAEEQKDLPPAVYDTWPVDGSEYAPLDTLIRVSFHEAIRNGSEGENSIIVRENNLTLIEGIVSYDGEELSFILLTRLKPNTTYTVMVFGVLSVTDGTPMEKPFYFTFTTQEQVINYIPTKILDSFPPNGTRIDYHKDNVSIWFSFSASMDVGSFAGNISIIPPVQFNLIPENNGKLLIIEFKENLLPGIKYRIMVESHLRDANGTTLQNPFDKIFYTQYEQKKTTDEKENWFSENYPAVAVIVILVILIVIVYLRPKKTGRFAGETPCPRCGRPVLRGDRICWSCKLRLDGESEEDRTEGKGEEDSTEVMGKDDEDEDKMELANDDTEENDIVELADEDAEEDDIVELADEDAEEDDKVELVDEDEEEDDKVELADDDVEKDDKVELTDDDVEKDDIVELADEDAEEDDKLEMADDDSGEGAPVETLDDEEVGDDIIENSDDAAVEGGSGEKGEE